MEGMISGQIRAVRALCTTSWCTLDRHVPVEGSFVLLVLAVLGWSLREGEKRGKGMGWDWRG